MTTQPYDIAGPADAPAILFLHAASYTHKMWLPQTANLQQEFRTIALDLPGHGALVWEPFTFPAAVAAVDAVIRQERLRRVFLVGLSLGGCVAMQYAAQQPGHVAGLVLSGCTFHAHSRMARLVLTGEGFVFPRGARQFTRALECSLRARYPAAVAEEIIAAGTYWLGAADAVRAMRGVDFRAKLAGFSGPTLILNGRRDWVHRSAERSFARAARNCRIKVLEGAGHVASLDQPEAFTEAVRAFASDVLPSSPMLSQD